MKLTSYLLCLFLLLNLSSCTSKSSRKGMRSVANDPRVAPYIPKDFVRAKTYGGGTLGNVLTNPFLGWIAQRATSAGLSIWMKKIGVKPSVRKNIKRKIRDRQFRAQVIPFLLALKEHYMAPNDGTLLSFNEHILEKYPESKIQYEPWLKHGMFDYGQTIKSKARKVKTKEEAEQLKKIKNVIIARVIELLDTIIFANLNFTWEKLPFFFENIKGWNYKDKKTTEISEAKRRQREAVVKEASDIIVRTVNLVLKNRELFGISGENETAVRGIVEKLESREAMVLSIIEFVYFTAYKHYQMFARKFDRRKHLHSWLENEASKAYQGKETNLWSYIDEALNKRRYGVHVVVDGLAGNLMEALAGNWSGNFQTAHSRNKFIKTIWREHLCETTPVDCNWEEGKTYVPKVLGKNATKLMTTKEEWQKQCKRNQFICGYKKAGAKDIYQERVDEDDDDPMTWFQRKRNKLRREKFKNYADNPHNKLVPRLFKKWQKSNLAKQSAGQRTRYLDRLAKSERTLKDPNYLPFFKNLYQRYEVGIARQGVSTTPTISVRNLPIAMTGAPVGGAGGTGLPNFHFVDREINRAYYFFGNDALRLSDIGFDLGMRNIFQRLPWVNGMNCGGQTDINAAESYDAILNLIVGDLSRDFGDILCVRSLQRRKAVEERLNVIRHKILSLKGKLKSGKNYNKLKKLLKELGEKENDGMPGYLLYYNPMPDHFAHKYGQFSDEIISPTGEFNRLDYWLLKISEVYKDAGIMDRTLFGMAGDHGLANAYYLLNPETIVFKEMIKEGIGLKLKKISSDEGGLPRLNHPEKYESMKDYDVIVASTAGGNFMVDLFIDQGENWVKQPTYKEARNLVLLNGQKVDMIKEILFRLDDTLDYLAVRNERFGIGKNIDASRTDTIIMALKNGKEAKARVIREGDRLYYSYDDHDLLNVKSKSKYTQIERGAPYFETYEPYEDLIEKCMEKADISDPASWCNEVEWRELTSYTERPDSVTQIAHLYDVDVAGTINLFPRQGIGYNSRLPGRHAGEYYHEKDAFVGIWGDPIQAKKRIRTAVNGSVPMVLYEWLSGERQEKGENGWGYDSFFEQLDIKDDLWDVGNSDQGLF